MLKSAGYGYLFGQVVGSSSYIIHSQRIGGGAFGAGALLGVCCAVGLTLRSA